MQLVTITIYPEIDGEDREFQATAEVSLVSELALSNGEQPEVEWKTVTGEDMTLPATEFESWLAARWCSLQLSAHDQDAIERALEDGDGSDADEFYSARGMVD